MTLAKIVKSNSHVEYVAQVMRPGEVDEAPAPADYAFGTFVAIPRASGDVAVGVVFDTTLVNPEFGALGPRLTSSAELQTLAPDQLPETATLIGVLLVGTRSAGGEVTQGVVAHALSVGDAVHRLDDAEFEAFHNAADGLRAAYLPLLLAHGHPLTSELALAITGRLVHEFPQHGGAVAVLRDSIAWRTRIEAAG